MRAAASLKQPPPGGGGGKGGAKDRAKPANKKMKGSTPAQGRPSKPAELKELKKVCVLTSFTSYVINFQDIYK